MPWGVTVSTGSYRVSITPTVPHDHALLHVLIQSAPISGSPFSLNVGKMDPAENALNAAAVLKEKEDRA